MSNFRGELAVERVEWRDHLFDAFDDAVPEVAGSGDVIPRRRDAGLRDHRIEPSVVHPACFPFCAQVRDAGARIIRVEFGCLEEGEVVLHAVVGRQAAIDVVREQERAGSQLFNHQRFLDHRRLPANAASFVILLDRGAEEMKLP